MRRCTTGEPRTMDVRVRAAQKLLLLWKVLQCHSHSVLGAGARLRLGPTGADVCSIHRAIGMCSQLSATRMRNVASAILRDVWRGRSGADAPRTGGLHAPVSCEQLSDARFYLVLPLGLLSRTACVPCPVGDADGSSTVPLHEHRQSAQAECTN